MMRKFLTSTLLAVALVSTALFTSPALAQVDFDVTLSHTGDNTAFIVQARSFCKKHLSIINARTAGKLNPDFPAVPGALERIPYTIGDIDLVSATRIQKGVTLIFGVLFETTSTAYDVGIANNLADLTIITPVRDRDEQMSLPTDID